MQKSSLYTSIGFHVGIFLAAMISVPWLKKDFVIPESVSVEFVEIDKERQTPKPVLKPAPPKKEEPKKEEPAPPKPKPAAQNSSDAPVVPVKKEEKVEEKKKVEKKTLVDEKALPDKKKKVEKEKTTTEKPPEKDFASVLRNLEVQDEKPAEKIPPEPDLNLDEAAAEEGQNVPLGKKLTMSEEDALRRQLQKCWNVPYGARDAENLVVEIFMVINPDRTLRAARIVNKSRYNSDTFFRAAADSAMRAVQHPLCSPFDLPPDKYDTWKQTTVTFDPSEMF